MHILRVSAVPVFLVFFFNDTATTEIYTLSLHDALPIFSRHSGVPVLDMRKGRVEDPDWAEMSRAAGQIADLGGRRIIRSEEHTSELQSRPHLVCRLLLEKKKRTLCLTSDRAGRCGWSSA